MTVLQVSLIGVTAVALVWLAGGWPGRVSETFPLGPVVLSSSLFKTGARGVTASDGAQRWLTLSDQRLTT